MSSRSTYCDMVRPSSAAAFSMAALSAGSTLNASVASRAIDTSPCQTMFDVMPKECHTSLYTGKGASLVSQDTTDYPFKTRAAAKLAGALRYNTGEPCKSGHIAERSTSNGTCLVCAAARQRNIVSSSEELAEKRRIRRREWGKENREKLIEKKRQWVEENKSHVLCYAVNYTAGNKAKIAGRRERANLRNPLQMIAQSISSSITARVRRKSILCDPEFRTSAYIREWLIRQPECECCKMPFDLSRKMKSRFQRPSIDRFVPSLGYTKGNTKLICVRCNMLKSNATLDEIMRIAQWMAGVSNG